MLNPFNFNGIKRLLTLHFKYFSLSVKLYQEKPAVLFLPIVLIIKKFVNTNSLIIMVLNYFLFQEKYTEGVKNGNIILGFGGCFYRMEFPATLVGTIHAGKNGFDVERKN
jgi:hypothetical protein